MRATKEVEVNDEESCVRVAQAQKSSGELEKNTHEWRSRIRTRSTSCRTS
jgi:hypothetical protein